MACDLLIVGGGLSGLALAEEAHRAGRSVIVLEARDRLGGRVLTDNSQAGAYDLGPAWIWPHNRRMRALATRLGLELFAQFSEGTLVFEDQGGNLQRDLDMSTMDGALRVAGGLGQIADRLAAVLPPDAIRLSHRVTDLMAAPDAIRVQGEAANGRFDLYADRVVLALPPRVIAGTVHFTPTLDPVIVARLAAVPTWMAGQAKLVAVYDQPFWRRSGLSGDAISHRGPLVEIHDASPAMAEAGALFGFVHPTFASADPGTLRRAGVTQLARLFGPAAGAPRAVMAKNWAEDTETATQDDRAAPAGHPAYRPIAPLTGAWTGRVSFAGTETARTEGGFLEGALEAAEDCIAALGAAEERVGP